MSAAKKDNETEISFEKAFARLEEILEKMNQGTVPLDESLKLYEEADQLIITCQKRLASAEKKVEMLIKNRSGELVIEGGKPSMQDLNSR